MQRQAFAPPDVTVGDVRLAAVGTQGGRIDVVLQIYNPNSFRLDASTLRYRVLVDTITLGEGTIDNRVTIMPKDSADVRVPVAFGFQRVVSVAGRLVQQGSLPFQLVGDLKVLTPFGSVTRAFDQRGTYDGVSISLRRPGTK